MSKIVDRYQEKVQETARYMLAALAQAGKQPMFVLGGQSYLRVACGDMDGFDSLSNTFGLDVLFIPHHGPFWMVAVVATKGVERSAFASVGAHTDIRKALRAAVRDLIGKAEVQDVDSPHEKRLNSWMNQWLYRLPKISRHDLDTLEEYAHTDIDLLVALDDVPRTAGVGLWWIYKQAYETITQRDKETA